MRKLHRPVLISNYSRINGDCSNCSSRLTTGQSPLVLWLHG
jgi:hypothetical protein